MTSKILEQTFILIKPDGVQRGLIGEIISRFEKKGYTLTKIYRRMMDKEFAMEHYKEHSKREFFDDLVNSIISGPIIAMEWEGEDVIQGSRSLIGATYPADYKPGTIRGDFSSNIRKNLIHGSDNIESAKREIELWFY